MHRIIKYLYRFQFANLNNGPLTLLSVSVTALKNLKKIYKNYPLLSPTLTSQILRDGVIEDLLTRNSSDLRPGRLSSQRLRGWRGVTHPARFRLPP